MADWQDLTRRASFASHQLLGWIFWDPRAKENLAALGVPEGLGHYIVNVVAPETLGDAFAIVVRPDRYVAAVASDMTELIHCAANLATYV